MFHRREIAEPLEFGIAVSVTPANELKQENIRNIKAGVSNLSMMNLAIGLLN